VLRRSFGISSLDVSLLLELLLEEPLLLDVSLLLVLVEPLLFDLLGLVDLEVFEEEGGEFEEESLVDVEVFEEALVEFEEEALRELRKKIVKI